MAEVHKDDGNDEYNKKNFNSAIHFYTCLLYTSDAADE